MRAFAAFRRNGCRALSGACRATCQDATRIRFENTDLSAASHQLILSADLLRRRLDVRKRRRLQSRRPLETAHCQRQEVSATVDLRAITLATSVMSCCATASPMAFASRKFGSVPDGSRMPPITLSGTTIRTSASSV